MGTTAPTTPSLDQVNDQALYQIRVNVPLATTGPGSSWEAFARTVGATAWPLYLTTTRATGPAVLGKIFPSTAGPVALVVVRYRGQAVAPTVRANASQDEPGPVVASGTFTRIWYRAWSFT
jgi:hypothetical protein